MIQNLLKIFGIKVLVINWSHCDFDVTIINSLLFVIRLHDLLYKMKILRVLVLKTPVLIVGNQP